MGEVWKALDPRLNREVAIKTSGAGFSMRFQQEAQAVAALNHPNICTLYDVGPDYLVMEFIQGTTLAERISQGPIALGETLTVARQIAEALNGAHERRIIHRDLKPANIKIRPDGSVKVLDFGLARTDMSSDEAIGDSPTLTMQTQPGVLLGTPGYMSPEEARGQSVDKRTDIGLSGSFCTR
jgi:eukaryotic-like serine/threonine-protein kinase